MAGKSKGSVDDLIYCHLYGVVGDWYLSEISEDREKAFGFQIINSEPVWEMDNWFNNSSKWGEIPIKAMQKLVNEKFSKEKDKKSMEWRGTLRVLRAETWLTVYRTIAIIRKQVHRPE